MLQPGRGTVRHTAMKRHPLIVAAAGLSAVLGVAGCSAAAVLPQALTSSAAAAEVTGFASRTTMVGGPLSQPVTVRVTGPQASRLALLVSQLASVPRSQVDCHEGLGLTYRIAFSTGSPARPDAVVKGYACDAAVTITVAGAGVSWRLDASCRLFQAVRQVLPARAKATTQATIGCDGVTEKGKE